MDSPVFRLTFALYLASCTLYLAQLAGGDAAARLQRGARWLLGAAFFSHMFDIGWSCVHASHPFANTHEALSFFSWLLVGAYLIVTVRQPLPLAGALLVPVALVLDIAAHVGTAGVQPPGATRSLLSTIHIGLAMLAVTAFAVAAADAAIYLYAEKQLKARRGHLPKGNVPSLEKLDRLNRRAIQLGFPLFTVAMVTGAVWQAQLPVAPGEAAQGMARFLTPQYLMATVAWLLYAGLILARFLAGWRGRRAALVTLGGFAASLSVLAIYYVRDLLGRGAGA